MKRILVWFLILGVSVVVARAQDAATQQQIDKLNGQVQDLLDAQTTQNKRIVALEKEISELGDRVSQDDLKKLAAQVQEIDKNRQEDNARVLKELERLGKALGAPSPAHKTAPVVPTAATTANSSPTPGSPQKGYDYVIHSGDTLSAIAKAYRDQGIKVTADQILKANPGLDPKSMKVGQKIFIPAQAQ